MRSSKLLRPGAVVESNETPPYSWCRIDSDIHHNQVSIFRQHHEKTKIAGQQLSDLTDSGGVTKGSN